MTEKQLWNSHFGNKGFVFTLDAAIAVVVVLILLAIANQYIIKSSEDTLADLQMIRTGSDVVTILDYTKSLDTLSTAIIAEKMGELLPENYDMRLNVSWAGAEGSTQTDSIMVGSNLPTKEFVATGKRFFLVTEEEEENETVTHYGMVRYWIWLE